MNDSAETRQLSNVATTSLTCKIKDILFKENAYILSELLDAGMYESKSKTFEAK